MRAVSKAAVVTGWMMVCASLLTGCVVPLPVPPPPPPLECDVTHEGDLILQGDEVFVIEDTVYCQKGDIKVYDNASLILRRSTLIFEQAYHGEFKFYFYAASSFLSEEAAIVSDHAYGIHFHDQSTGQVSNSNLSEAQFNLPDNTFLSIARSEVMFFQLWNSATLEVETSRVNELGGWAQANETARIVDLRPGYFGDWNLHRDNQVQGWSLDITLVDSVVNNLGFGVGGSASFVFENCQIGLDVRDEAEVVVRNSEIGAAGFVFKQGQTLTVDGLTKGYVSYWSLQDIAQTPTGRPSLIIENSEILRFWNIWNNGADLTVIDSDLGYLWSAGVIIPDTIVTRSQINSLVFQSHQGTVRFSNSSVSWRFFPPHDSVSSIEGTVTFGMDNIEFEEGPWRNSAIERKFPVVVQDSAGGPLAGMDLDLSCPDGQRWSGKTDSEGKASFEIVFNDDNFTMTCSLNAPSLSQQVGVGLLIDTPLVIRA